ncbi:hypothetical protein C2G38_2235681 [Gigaspora rosea]|uniref:Galactose oxidase n=1 Tax=Gigaspora rosea TaxID=44941 RepID=A0A397TY61_9GLOM|nr:hypothetical protein C2G38_2235681 [Gigaspora rosea]
MGSPTLQLYNDLYEFDTILLSWNQITAPNAPSPRSHNTATLLPNGKIIYIGGVSQDTARSQTNLINMIESNNSLSKLIKLDVSSEPYQYSELKPSGINPPPPLSYHSAHIYSDYMIIAFGNITNDITDSNETSSEVYLLYIPCLTWESTFIPGRTDCKGNQKDSSNLKIIIGCSIAFGVVIIAGIICV